MGIFMLGLLRLVVPRRNKANFPLRRNVKEISSGKMPHFPLGLLRSVVPRRNKANFPLGRNVKEISSGKMPHFPRQLKMLM